ncbi:MAG: acetate kinase [Patescibacteria group bacterium]|nr:acetate kinase [Patescibacteria group bacterium]
MIFVINSGSSTLKFRVFDADLKELGGGIVERVGLRRSFIECAFGGDHEHRTFAGGLPDHEEALNEVFSLLYEFGFEDGDVKAVGHRVVHGGERFTRPILVTSEVLRQLRKYDKLAPLHNPANIAGIEAATRVLPKAKQVAVFDTAFHATIPDFAHMYALPWRWYEKHGIRKYGFHGISHQYVSEEAARKMKKPSEKVNLITCHLGSGASVTAVRGGESVDTSMGFTPLQGLVMSTRCGDIDPAIPLFMIREVGRDPDDVYDDLNHESGLKGLTGYADLREVLSMLGHDFPGFSLKKRPNKEEKEQARIAVDMFCYSVAKHIGSYAGILGSVDAIVFTAGIGERSQLIRKKVMSMVKLKPKPKVMVVPTNEELMIAREVGEIV